MYYIIMTFFAAVFAAIGLHQLDGGLLWLVSLWLGGVYAGHVVTECLNKGEQ